MAFFTRLILVILCALMFVVNRRYKFAILVLSTICFCFVVLPYIPFGGGKYVLSNCFIISELPFIVRHLRNIKKSIIWKVLVIVLISIIIQIINSPHYNDSLTNVVRIFLMDFFAKYLALGYAFVCIVSERDLRPTMKVSFYGLLILTAFGILNYVTGVADFINALGAGMKTNDVTELLGEKFTYSDRFRVQAMFFNPFDYGYICIVLTILVGGGYLYGLISKTRLYIVIACCVFGIFTCGCRTVIVCALLAYVTYLLFGERLKKRAQYFLLICIIGLISYSTIPYVKDKVDSTLTAFETDADYGGSSIEMRAIQYATVLKYVDGYEMFGRGKGFFQIDLGWEYGKRGLKDEDLWGLEGVFMGLILESGIVGVTLYLLIYYILFYYSYKYRRVDRRQASLSLALLIAYFSFANMTGELQSVFPTLLVAGSFLSILYNKDRYIRIMKLQEKLQANSNA